MLRPLHVNRLLSSGFIPSEMIASIILFQHQN